MPTRQLTLNGSRAEVTRRGELHRKGVRLLQQGAGLIRTVEIDSVSGLVDLESTGLRLAGLAQRLGDQLAYADVGSDPLALVASSRLLAAVQATRYELQEFLAGQAQRRREALEAGLQELRRLNTPEELVSRVCPVVAASCGFDRVMLSRVEGSLWRPWKSFAVTEHDNERTFRKWLLAAPEIELSHVLPESEMARRQEPGLVRDGQHDRRIYPPLLVASGTTSYVAAPLAPSGRVIGFLHADYEDAEVLPLDRDVLAAFAAGFDTILERVVLTSRLRRQRDTVRATLQAVESILAEEAEADVGFETSPPPRVELPALGVQARASLASSRIAALLTERELEVLTMMATGATNQRIAQQLVISEGTVKSHVKRILRKLRATNRAEAISLYLRLAVPPSPG